jgi:hypothetical protein
MNFINVTQVLIIIGDVLVEFVKPLLARFNFIHKIIACVKDEVFNLNTLGFALSVKFFVNHYNWKHHLQGFVLDMQCPKLVNTPSMMQKLYKKPRRMPDKVYKKLQPKTKKSKKGQQSGIGLALRFHFLFES